MANRSNVTPIHRSGRRPRRGVAGVLAMVGVLLVPVAASAGTGDVPAPAVAVTDQPAGGISAIFGTNAAGDTFYNQNTAGNPGAVLHGDGTTTPLAQPLSGDGEIGPDGRLWLPLHGSLWAVAGDGTMTEYPVSTPQASPTTGILVVRVGVDGKIWFLDTKRSSVGAISSNGTGLSVFPVAGDRTLQRLSRGADGRMWVTRGTGQLQAVTIAGTVSDYSKVGYPVEGLASNPSGLYVTVGGKLKRVAADGSITTVTLPGNLDAGGRAVESQGWLWFGNTTAVSPSGRTFAFSMPVEWTYREVSIPADFGITQADLAPDLTGGFVGHVAGKLARIASPVLTDSVLLNPYEQAKTGVYYLRILASDRTPGGAARAGTFDVHVTWDRYIPDGLTVIEEESEVVGTMTIDGNGTAQIPIVPSMVARLPQPYTLDHGHCCEIYLQKTGVPSEQRTSSRAVPYVSDAGDGFDSTQFKISPQMAWLVAMDIEAIGRPIDDAGALYWARRLANGTTRQAVVRSVTASETWRKHRVVQAYVRFLRRNPDAGGLAYWAGWLKTHTPAELDAQIGGTAAARDAEGTTNAARGQHLAHALRLGSSYGKAYASQLDAGTQWTTVLRNAYTSNAAVQQRMIDLGALRDYHAPLATLVSQYRATGDERVPLATDLAAIEVAPV